MGQRLEFVLVPVANADIDSLERAPQEVESALTEG